MPTPPATTSPPLQQLPLVNGFPFHVFVSYSWRLLPDEVRKVAEELKRRGFIVWLDMWNLRGDINESMTEGLKSSAVVCPFLSSAYEISKNAMRELNYAINKSLKVVPIHLEPPEVLDLTTFLVGDLLYFDLASQSVLSAVGTAEWDNTMDKLADFIKSELYNSKIPPQPPQRRQAAEPKLLLPDKRDRPNHISGKILARTPSPMTKKAKEDPMQTLKSWLKPRSLLDLRLDEIRLSRCRNTRAWLLQEVEQWMTTSDERRKHLWLAGPAGAGKSVTVANVQHDLQRQGHICAMYSFNFELDRDNRGADSLIQTLAFQLAAASPIIRSSILQAYIENSNIAEWSSITKFEELLFNPLKEFGAEVANNQAVGSNQNVVGKRVFLIIDALDECGDFPSKARLDLLRMLSTQFPLLPEFVRVFVSSRMQEDFQRALTSTFKLVNIDLSNPMNTEDARIFSLSIVEDVYEFLNMPVAQHRQEIDAAAEAIAFNSNGLFLWLRFFKEELARSNSPLTLFQAQRTFYLRQNHRSQDPQRPLRLGHPAAASTNIVDSVGHLMDSKYKEVFSAAFAGATDVGQTNAEALKNVIGLIAIAKEPLTIPSLAALVGLEHETVRILLLWLRAVLDINDKGEIRAIHKSLIDMIVDPNRSAHPILVDVPAMHAFMTARCLVILLNSLRDNICDLSPNLFLNQVPDIAARVEKSIPRHLRYAAKFWVHHLFETPRENRQLLRFETMSGASSSLFNMVTRLCRDKFLNWLEVLCYLDEMAVALSATWQLKTWFEDVVESVMEGELQQGSTTEGTAVAAVPYTAPTAKRQLFGSFRMFRHRAATAPAALPALLKPWNRSRTPLSPPPTPPTLASRGQHPREVMIAESREIAHDGYRLLRDFAGALTAQGAGGEWVSPLHLYYSGLPFCPTAGALYRTYHDRIVHGSGVLMALSPSVDSASGAVASLGVRPPAKFHQRMSVPTIGNAPKIWGACEATLEGHAGAVWDVAFSTDELLIATAGDDGTVRIWDAETAEEIRAIKPAHKGPVGCLCWFGTNSLHVVSGGDDGFVKMWEFDSAVMILQSQKHVKRVLGVASSSDGRIYSCDDGGFVYAFDAVKFNNSHHDHTPHHHNPAPTDAIYSASSFQGPTRGARYIRVSRDNNYVITAGKGGDLQVFDRDLQPQRRIAAGHQGYSWCLAITPDSRHVLSVGEDRAVKMWNIATGDVEREFLGHAGSLWTVAIAAGGSRAVSGGEDGVLHVWDVAGTVEPSRSGDSKTVAPLSRLHGHEGYIIKADITTDGRKIVSCGDMGVARLWDTVAKDEPRDQSGTFGRVLTVAVSKGSVSPARPSLIVSAGDEGIVRLWDLETRAALHELVNRRGRVSTVAVTPDGSRVISGGHDGLVCVWTLGELFKEGDDNYVSGAGRAVSTTLLELKGHDAPVRAVAITNDGRFVVSGGHDRHVRVWSAETGRQLNDLPGHTSRVLAVAVAGTIAPGRSLRILSGGADFRVILWDGSTGEMLQTLGTYDVAITSAALASFPSPNGVSGDQDLRAAFGVADGRVFVQDIALDRNSRGDIRQSQELQVADFAVRDVKFVAPPPFIATPSPLCYIATASEDGVVRLWEARPQNREETDAKAREVLSLTPDDSSSGRSVAISDDGITAVSAHADGRLYVWDLEVQTCIEAVDTHEWTVQLDHGVTITLARSGWVHVVRHDGTRGMAVLYVPRRCRKRLWFDRRSERVALGGLPSSEGSMLIEFRGGPCLAAPDK